MLHLTPCHRVPVETLQVMPREGPPLLFLIGLEDPHVEASYLIQQKASGDKHLSWVHLAIVLTMAALNLKQFL
jgi:hypothetical protein